MENSGSAARVPPGFRFHPTDEELINFYLKKKVAMTHFNLDHVIPEVDLNKLEPWDLREKCKVDASHQTEWYFFSHKDKKYPTGTRTNRATAAGFWKATGRDKCVLSNAHRIGMRKTLVFYRGRAPHGKKTDWIMHEYRLEDKDYDQSKCSNNNEEGWVVCRVFKKRNLLERGNNHDSNSNNMSDEESPITAPPAGKYKKDCVNFPCKIEAMEEATPFLQLPQLESSDIATASSSTVTIPTAPDFIKRNLTEGSRDSIDLLPSLSSDNDTEECENKPFFPIMDDEFIYNGQLADGWSLYDSITRYHVPEICTFPMDLPQTPLCLMSGKMQQTSEFPSSCEVDLWNFTR